MRQKIVKLKRDSLETLKNTLNGVLEEHDGELCLRVGKKKLFEVNDIYDENKEISTMLKERMGQCVSCSKYIHKSCRYIKT